MDINFNVFVAVLLACIWILVAIFLVNQVCAIIKKYKKTSSEYKNEIDSLNVRLRNSRMELIDLNAKYKYVKTGYMDLKSEYNELKMELKTIKKYPLTPDVDDNKTLFNNMNTKMTNNNRLIKRYPFLAFRNYNGNIDYQVTWYDSIPDGWKIAFGDMMMDDIKSCLEEADYVDKFEIEDIKEKYGELRLYYKDVPSSIYDKLNDIIDTYSTLSANICIECGRPDVSFYKRGWIIPLCLNCYSKQRKYKGLSRNEILQNYINDTDVDHKAMKEELIYTRYHDGHPAQYSIDLRPTAKRIRDAYLARQLKEEIK